MTSTDMAIKMARASVLAHAQNPGTSWSKIAKNLLALKKPDEKFNWNDIPVDFPWSNFPSGITWEQLNQTALFENFEVDDHNIRNKLQVLDLLQEEDIYMTLCIEDGFPEQILDANPNPPFLFHRGEFEASDKKSIAIIGTRQASDTALKVAEDFGKQIANFGLPVVSGLASGVDTAALTGSLKAGGRTIAVIGTGIDVYYPPANHALQDQIAEQGLLISQFLPGAAPTKKSFPMRNAVMAAYSSSSLVIQADERSGARLQARVAAEQNRSVFLYEPIMKYEKWAVDAVEKNQARFVATVDDLINQNVK